MKYQLQNKEQVLMELKPASRAALYCMIRKFWNIFLVLFLWEFFLLALPEDNSLTDIVHRVTRILMSFIGWQRSDVLFVLCVIIILLAFFYLFFRLVISGYSYVITNQRVILIYGFIVLNHRIIPVDKINDLSMNSSFPERIFGLGSVYLATLGTLFGSFNGNSNVGSVNNPSEPANNTRRLEYLSLSQCEDAMAAISRAMQK